ncbi:MAG: nuclease-related domain-containing protein [Gammaproteobacteria bacterium]|nr:nuclease-related domain-containing protein [Gammaproteobacteria bacterium]
MELELFHRIVMAGVFGVVAGMAAWLVAKGSLLLWSLWATRRPVGQPMPSAPGDSERRAHRRLGRELAAWLASLLVSLTVFLEAYFFGPTQIEMQVAMWGWILALLLVIGDLGFVGYMLYRIVRARRRHRYAWAMRRAVGGILERTCLGGYRLFNEVRIEDEVIDHVLLGEKGVFLISTIARRPPRKLDAPTVKLKAGKLGFSDGVIEGIPVGDAARKLSLLGSELTRLVGHRVQVKSIIAVPGWNSQPDADANHLLLNENNLVSLASWNSADAFLMHEDLPNLESFLNDAASIKLLD